jgi:hypothetical protein
LYIIVLIIHLRLPVFVAYDAGENREVVGIRMAGGATRPLILVITIKDGEEVVIVVEGRIVPSVDVVTFEAGRRVALSAVLLLIVGFVAAKAIVLVDGRKQRREIRRRRMAGIAREYLVRPDKVEAIGGGRMAEGRAHPGIIGVALLAFKGETVSGVLLVVIGLVARQTVLIIFRIEQRSEIRRRRVARGTLQRVMCAQQLESVGRLGMIEDSIFPGVDVVAFETGRRETGARMLLVIIRLMTGQAVVLIRGIE